MYGYLKLRSGPQQDLCQGSCAEQTLGAEGGAVGSQNASEAGAKATEHGVQGGL